VRQRRASATAGCRRQRRRAASAGVEGKSTLLPLHPVSLKYPLPAFVGRVTREARRSVVGRPVRGDSCQRWTGQHARVSRRGMECTHTVTCGASLSDESKREEGERRRRPERSGDSPRGSERESQDTRIGVTASFARVARTGRRKKSQEAGRTEHVGRVAVNKWSAEEVRARLSFACSVSNSVHNASQGHRLCAQIEQLRVQDAASASRTCLPACVRSNSPLRCNTLSSSAHGSSPCVCNAGPA